MKDIRIGLIFLIGAGFFVLQGNIEYGYSEQLSFNEWRYESFEAAFPHKEYESYYVDGKRTGQKRYNGKNHEGAVSWRIEGYERVHPNKEYERKYLDGIKTSETRYTGKNWNNLFFVKDILVVNKAYPLPADYYPGLNPDVLQAFDQMSNDAKALGLNIYLSSGFRSYRLQADIYKNNLNIYGQSVADTFSARPGYSEHQTGLAFDLNTISDSFAKTKEGVWVKNNCHKYGFIIRYPEGKQGITGYKYEPWHLRYVGIGNAEAIFNSGLCLEEYLGLTSP
ncbi:MAG: M15 family metallopeptidase [Peptococcaceae bacterium]|nr:M15 family metallopeptidase [Peptococcaceae bacterium]